MTPILVVHLVPKAVIVREWLRLDYDMTQVGLTLPASARDIIKRQDTDQHGQGVRDLGLRNVGIDGLGAASG